VIREKEQQVEEQIMLDLKEQTVLIIFFLCRHAGMVSLEPAAASSVKTCVNVYKGYRTPALIIV
jgi:hypothetical protein